MPNNHSSDALDVEAIDCWSDTKLKHRQSVAHDHAQKCTSKTKFTLHAIIRFSHQQTHGTRAPCVLL